VTPLSISEFKFSQPIELDISIVIVSFNTREILLNCLESIQKHTEGISYEVIVVDNASEDKTIEAVAERFLSVQVYHQKVRGLPS
jgi:GT2 family glycosyltransferase